MAKQKDETPLEIGDAVYLHSGSPKMTIVAIMKNFQGVEVANVVWMGFRTAELREAQIPVAALVRTTPYA